ncbi:MAG TPA: methyltransferase domain-containing protein [Solirubrobacteraceae bacterium]|nr:methyltransferase domain-containing protein [Solirubrobacteraceae bacterium]
MNEPCPLCGAPSIPAFATPDRNRRLSEVEFRYRECTGCGVTFLQNVPADLARYYSADYHRAPVASELDTWAAYEAYKLELIRPYLAAGSIVDIGSSYGAFAYLASRAGYDVTVAEVDPDACRFIEEVIGVRAIQTAAPEEALKRLPEPDAITLWHSVEHLSQPWAAVQTAAERVRPGGVVVVSTPNPVGVQARALKGRWAHVDAPRHLFLIPPEALLRRATSYGLVPLAVTGTDIETRRCNRMGWQRGLEELGLRVRGVWGAGAALAIAMRPLESRPNQASAYTAVLQKPSR